MKKVIVFGNNNLAEMLYLETQKYNEMYFAIEAFCVDEDYKNQNSFCNKPLYSLEEASVKYPPDEYDMISTALCSTSGLRNKMVVFEKLKKVGYSLANYISPLADVSPDVQIGENNIILSFAKIGLSVKMGNANIVWHYALIDHNTNVGNGNFFAGGCKTAGFVNVGSNCWIGLNSTIIQHINIADETLVGAGAVMIRDTEKHTTYVGNPAKAISRHEDVGIKFSGRK